MTVWVGRYSMVSGQVREHGPWLVDRVRRREEESLRLLVLAEPTDARSAEFCHEVAEAVAALFARESLSITGGLLRALRQAHANLAEWNRRSLREHRVAVGVTCVVVRDEEVLVGQAGPGTVYLRQGDQVTRLTTEGLPAAVPLGSEQPIDPLFTSATLKDGQVLMLSANAEQALGPRTIEAALYAGPEHTLARIFPHTRTLTDMTAVLVADLDIDEEQAAAPLDFDPTDVGAYDEEPEDYEGREVSITGLEDRPAPPRAKRPRGWNVVGGGGRTPLPSLRRVRAAGRRGVGGMGGVGGVGGLGNGAPLVPWRTAAIVAGAALLLALLAWLVLPGLLSEDRAQELEDALTQAHAQLAAAAVADTPAGEREALRNALARVERARSLAADDPRIAQVEADVEARLLLLDAVTNVGTLTEVLAFEGSVTAPVQPEQLIIGGRALWLRESGRGRIVRIDPTGAEEPAERFVAGQTYGGVVARDPLAMAWDASTGRLLVVDAGRSLFAIEDDPDVLDSGDAEPEVLTLRDAQELRSVAALAVYLGNLYILDPVAGEVWKYLPAADGFDSERSGLLGGVDLEGASGLAVDGEVFILDGDAVRRFIAGREVEPILSGIDEPPQSATGLVEDVLRGLLYLADRGHSRIVATEGTGPFLRQYRHPDFIDLRGVAVAPDGTALYALTGAGVTSFPIQPRQE
ncbi:MAG: hypothetical protein M0R73_11560 [Dehalococcoidia bacterium]|nr:hypothetical protein [Dehalococcoidia bacterium]